jgi:hypothetical protein
MPSPDAETTGTEARDVASTGEPIKANDAESIEDAEFLKDYERLKAQVDSLKEDADPKVHLLRDEPVDEDQIGGAHVQLADAVARMIRREPRGAAIALEGSYGAGKSSIIRMVTQRLAKASAPTTPEELRAAKHDAACRAQATGRHDQTGDVPTRPHPQYHVMTFDAWHHEGETLRLAFLQALVHDLADKGWLTGAQRAKWRAELEILEGRRKVEITATRPIGTRKQAWAVMLLAAGIGGWAANELLTAMLVGFGMPQGVAVAVVIVVCVILVIVAVWMFFLAGREIADKERADRSGTSGPASPPSDPDSGQSDSTLLAHAEAFALGRGGQTARSTTSGSGAISSRTFEDRFSRVLADALQPRAAQTQSPPEGTSVPTPPRVLVIVMDNLDRLEPAEAMRVWNTLRVFSDAAWLRRDRSEAASANSHQGTGLERVWLIAPFDRARLMDKSQASPADGNQVALLDKVFHARFDVPAPRLVNWQAYFRSLLARAIPNVFIFQRDEAVKVVAAHFETLTPPRPPTPRELIVIVNDIGALVRTYNTKYQLSTLATFVMLRRRGESIDKIRTTLTTHQPLEWLKQYEAGTWRIEQELRGLVVGTPMPGTSRELELQREFFNALRDASRPVLEDFITTEDFWAWLSTRTQVQEQNRPRDVWRAIRILLEAVATTERTTSAKQATNYQVLCELVCSLLESDARLNPATARPGAEAALKLLHRYNSASAYQVERALLRQLGDCNPSIAKDIVAVIHRAEQLGVTTLGMPISVSLRAEHFVELALALYRGGPRARKLLQWVVDSSDSPQFVLTQVLGAALDREDRREAVRAVLASHLGATYAYTLDPAFVSQHLQTVRSRDSVNMTGRASQRLDALMLVPALKARAKEERDVLYSAANSLLNELRYGNAGVRPSASYVLVELLLREAGSRMGAPRLPASVHWDGSDSAILGLAKTYPRLNDYLGHVRECDHPAIGDGEFVEIALLQPDEAVDAIAQMLGANEAERDRWLPLPPELFARSTERLDRLRTLSPQLAAWVDWVRATHAASAPCTGADTPAASAAGRTPIPSPGGDSDDRATPAPPAP